MIVQCIWLYFQITIDTSAPVAGVVHDGPGWEDIDYQQSLDVRANWHNFFDRESGIILYQYGVALHCLTLDDFSNPSVDGVILYSIY